MTRDEILSASAMPLTGPSYPNGPYGLSAYLLKPSLRPREAFPEPLEGGINIRDVERNPLQLQRDDVPGR